MCPLRLHFKTICSQWRHYQWLDCSVYLYVLVATILQWSLLMFPIYHRKDSSVAITHGHRTLCVLIFSLFKEGLSGTVLPVNIQLTFCSDSPKNIELYLTSLCSWQSIDPRVSLGLISLSSFGLHCTAVTATTLEQFYLSDFIRSVEQIREPLLAHEVLEA